MASSSSSSPVVRLDSSSSGLLRDENGPPAPDRVASAHIRQPSLHLHSPSFWIETQKSVSELQTGSTFLRSHNGVMISSLVVATTAFSLSFFPLGSLAAAAELEVNNTVAVSDMANNSHQSAISDQIRKVSNNSNLGLDPSISSNPVPGLSLSIAIPIPHEQEWKILLNGHIAPSPHAQTQETLILKCPPWTPSELEMILPDFNGRPKPFPRKGHHWSASLIYNDAALQLADLMEDAQNEFTKQKSSLPEAKLDKLKEDGKPKVLGMDIFTCFSL